MKKILFILSFLSSLVSFAQNDLQTQSKITLDNEKQIIFKSSQGYSHTFDSLSLDDSSRHMFNINAGLFNSFALYQDTSISKKFNEIRTEFSAKFFKGTKIYFSPAVLISSDWSPLVYEFNTFIPFKKFNIEINSERDLVGPRAIKKTIISQYNGISLDYSPTSKLTLVGSVQRNNITDGNLRYFYITRVIYSHNWYYLDLRMRNMRGGEWSEYYFSPESINQYNVGAGLTRRLFSGNTKVKSYLGLGLQKVDNQSMTLLIFDLNLSSKLSKKIDGEANIGFRNINQYLFTFGTFKLKYKF
jgi:hypothetical protein